MKNTNEIEVEKCPICGYWVDQSDYPEPWESARYITRPVLCSRCEYEETVNSKASCQKGGLPFFYQPSTGKESITIKKGGKL